MLTSSVDPVDDSDTTRHLAASPATRTALRVCPLCEAACGLSLQVATQDDAQRPGRTVERVVSLRGDAADVFSAGYLCPKAVALKDLHDDPDRLHQPLIKRGGVHVPVTWDEAFAEIEQRLGSVITGHGRDAVALALGNPNVHKLGLSLYGPQLIKALGSRQLYSASSVDQVPRQLACGWLYGHWMSVPVPDIDRSDFLLLLGANPLASNGSMWTVPDFRGRAKALQARGGRLIVVDPRRTETAAMADEHLPIRPGGDVFLLAAMAHTLFTENLVRLGHAEPWVIGVDAVEAALAGFSAELAAPHCGITAERIRSLTREFAAARSGAVYGRLGTTTQAYGTLCAWLIDVLNVLTGRLDVAGGLMFPKSAAFAANTAGAPGSGRGVRTGRSRSRVSQAPEVMGEYPLTCLAEEIDTPGAGQVRALITVATNPVLSAPGSARLDAALGGLDFMVSVDIYLNETTRHADVILPGRSPLEDAHYDVSFSQLSTRNQARFSPAVLAADADHPPEWQVLLRLAAIASGRGAAQDLSAWDDELFAQEAKRLAGERAPALLASLPALTGPERRLDLALRFGPHGDGTSPATPSGLTLASLQAAPHGIDLGPLAPRLPEVLRTPSGSVELAHPSLLADLARPLAVLAEDAAPVPALVVIGRRDVRSNNSWMHNLPTLAKGPFRGAALVHPQDAQRLGLIEGGQARLARVLDGGAASGPEAGVTVQVSLDDGLMPGVVCLPHGWGHDRPGTRLQVAAQRPGANLNAVLDAALRDPLSGNAVLSGVAVTLVPVLAP